MLLLSHNPASACQSKSPYKYVKNITSSIRVRIVTRLSLENKCKLTLIICYKNMLLKEQSNLV